MFLGPDCKVDADFGICDRAISFDGLFDLSLIITVSWVEARWHCLPDEHAGLARGLAQEPCTLALCRLSAIISFFNIYSTESEGKNRFVIKLKCATGTQKLTGKASLPPPGPIGYNMLQQGNLNTDDFPRCRPNLHSTKTDKSKIQELSD